LFRIREAALQKSRREKIFDRFYQGSSAENAIKAGSGIGLALSKELIKMHKGRISLKSQEGVGTELTILLPAIKKDPDKKELTEAPAEITDSDSLTEDQVSSSPSEDLANCDAPIVLILEDNTELLDFIHSIFEEDYMVLTAENGESGLELARETIPDLIISDVMMPKMDGNKLCRKIKEDFRTSHIPVILLTALSSKQHEKEGILGGADEYITKPFDPSLLKIRADQLLATRVC
jgi:CheY-like chemotaxis protein